MSPVDWSQHRQGGWLRWRYARWGVLALVIFVIVDVIRVAVAHH